MRLILILALFSLVSCATGASKKEKAELHLQLGVSYFDQGNFPLALRELLAAEELDSSNPVVQNNLGLTYFMRERPDLAESHLRKAVDLKKDYSEARNNLARVLIEENKYEEAEKELNVVLADLTYPNFEKAYINLGLARFNRKQYDGARLAFQRAVDAKKDSCVGLTYLGKIDFEQGRYKRAVEILDRAVGFCQEQLYDEPHYYSALAWYRLGDKDRAVARFNEIVKLYPDGRYREKSKAMLELIRKGGEQ